MSHCIELLFQRIWNSQHPRDSLQLSSFGEFQHSLLAFMGIKHARDTQSQIHTKHHTSKKKFKIKESCGRKAKKKKKTLEKRFLEMLRCQYVGRGCKVFKHNEEVCEKVKVDLQEQKLWLPYTFSHILYLVILKKIYQRLSWFSDSHTDSSVPFVAELLLH